MNKDAKLDDIIGKQAFIKNRINLYLNELTEMPEVRLKVKDYALSSIAEGKNYKEYLSGMKELVIGKGEGTGLLQKYYTTFAYDTYNDVDAIINEHMGQSLGLRFFIYAGSIIANSRQFCRKRAGKVYEISETKQWKCDPTLIGKPKGVKCDNTYNYTQRGRYRCRHYIRFITNDLAIRMRPSVKQKFLMGKKLSTEEILTIDKYTSDYSYRFNNELRSGRVSNEVLRDSEVLSNILKGSSKYEGTVYRGMGLNNIDNAKFVNNVKKGNIFSDKGFLSTSADKNEAINFVKSSTGKNKYFFEIQSKSGVNIQNFATEGREFEKEILFNKGSSFKIDSHTIQQTEIFEIHKIKMTEL